MRPVDYPKWVRARARNAGGFAHTREVLRRLGVRTVCEDAHCPNLPECWGHGAATFMVMGGVCTRSCRYCAVQSGCPAPLQADEPVQVAEACAQLGLRHVVITSVTRDDLDDGGAAHLASTVLAIRDRVPGASVEVLAPDFGGSIDALDHVLSAGPDVFAHNIEMVPRLYPLLRPGAQYETSLGLVSSVDAHAAPSRRTFVKSGIMLGLGETRVEVTQVISDLRSAGCELLSVGQYLSPSPEHAPVARFVCPDEFQSIRGEALEMGFLAVEAGPLVRSSYRSYEMLQAARSGVPH